MFNGPVGNGVALVDTVVVLEVLEVEVLQGMVEEALEDLEVEALEDLVGEEPLEDLVVVELPEDLVVEQVLEDLVEEALADSAEVAVATLGVELATIPPRSPVVGPQATTTRSWPPSPTPASAVTAAPRGTTPTQTTRHDAR